MAEMVSIDTLTEMISAGWGNVPRNKIPENWPEIPGPGDNYQAAWERRREAAGLPPRAHARPAAYFADRMRASRARRAARVGV